MYCLSETTIPLGSEGGGSEQTRPLKSSSSQDPSEPSTPDFDPVTDKRLPPPPQFENKDHIIQIEPDSPSKTLYITKEEDVKLQKPITPTSSIKSEQILSASALQSQYREVIIPPTPDKTPPEERSETPLSVRPSSLRSVTSTPDRSSASQSRPSPSRTPDSEVGSRSSIESRASRDERPKSAVSARSPRAPPSPRPSMPTDKGKSKITGKVVSGWL